MQFIIPIYMEMSCHLKQTKMPQNRRVEQVLSKGVGTSGRGEEVGKEYGKVIMI
jgi:hypothetical protein